MSSLPLYISPFLLLCFSILCCSYLLVKGLTGQANLFLNIASGKNSLSLSLSSSSPKVGQLYYRGTGYLACIILIDPQMGWLHYSGTGYLATIISINPLPYPSSPKVGRLYYRGTGYLASIISINPQMGWLHYSGTGYLATIISIDLTLSFLLVKPGNTALGKTVTLCKSIGIVVGKYLLSVKRRSYYQA